MNTKSDSKGKYQFSNLSSGEYVVYAESSDELRSHYSTVYVSTGLTLNIVLKGEYLGDGVKVPILLVPGIMGSSTSNWSIPTLPKNAPDWNDSAWQTDSYGLYDPPSIFELGWRNLIESLDKAGYKKGELVFPVPYDWRMDVRDSAREYLKKWIEEAKRISGSTKVHVIAHSMGGLVTRAYIQGDDYGNDIDKFAMVGTPNHGSGMAYYSVAGRRPCYSR